MSEVSVGGDESEKLREEKSAAYSSCWNVNGMRSTWTDLIVDPIWFRRYSSVPRIDASLTSQHLWGVWAITNSSEGDTWSEQTSFTIPGASYISQPKDEDSFIILQL